MGQIACDKDIRETDRVRFEPRLRHCRDRLASSVGTKRTLQLLLIYYLPAQQKNTAARLNTLNGFISMYYAEKSTSLSMFFWRHLAPLVC